MNHTNFRLFTAILLMVCCVPMRAAETAEQLLEKCSSNFSNAPSVSVSFTLNYGGQSSNCSLVIAHDKYRLSSPDIQVWYDGKTQWSYNATDKELSITEPTEDEMFDCNPFIILNNYKSVYSYRRLEGNKNDIELVAKNRHSSIRKVVISIDDKTYMPTQLVVTLSNGRTFAVKIISCKTGKEVNASVFQYNKNEYPAKNINDLR